MNPSINQRKNTSLYIVSGDVVKWKIKITNLVSKIGIGVCDKNLVKSNRGKEKF